MIIWGSRGREILQESGTFHCPECESLEDYRLYRVATYFTLYFVPLFETESHGEFVRCDECGGRFKPAVLDYRSPNRAEKALLAVRADLESGNPVQMARTKLVNAGGERPAADKLVSAAAGDGQWDCVACNLTYIAGVKHCAA